MEVPRGRASLLILRFGGTILLNNQLRVLQEELTSWEALCSR
jgi:hypothetical protein